MSLHFRAARPDEANSLSALALRSKGYWGYSADFLESCRSELTLSPQYISRSPVFILEEERRLVGFYGLRVLGSDAELLYLFVEPAAVNRGLGKRLWAHLIGTAARLGIQKISIESDPHAEAFYRAMGATLVGNVSSPVQPDRKLPLLEFCLENRNSSG